MFKDALSLKAGDKIVGGQDDTDSYHLTLYTGVVKEVVVVDRGIQVNFEEGGHIVRAEGHIFEVVTQ